MSRREGGEKDTASDIQHLCLDALTLLNQADFPGAVDRFDRLEQEVIHEKGQGLQISPSFLLLMHHNAAYCHQQ
jgi:hypothetical protein